MMTVNGQQERMVKYITILHGFSSPVVYSRLNEGNHGMEDQQQHQEQTSPNSNDMNRAFVTAFRDWFQLFSDAAWKTDLEKRRAMLQARLVYQEAKLSYLYVQRVGTS